MNSHSQKRRLSAALALVLAVCLCAGCAAAETPAKADQPSEAMKVYSCGDIQIGIPEKYLSQLTVETTPQADASGTVVMWVLETASLKAGEKDGYTGDSVFGSLFSIVRLTRPQYEQMLTFEYPGCTLIGYTGTDSGHHYTFPGGETYYACITPTDVQYYRGADDTPSPDSADFQNWGTLCQIYRTVMQDILTRNALTPCDTANGISHQTYTYDSKHAFVRYFRYYTRYGSRAEYDTLVLSQPVKQGKGGIWCVERVSDEYGQENLIFPGDGKVTAASYYESLQALCDSGKRPDLLQPLAVAKAYVQKSGAYNDKPTGGSFRQVGQIDRAYQRTNTQADALVTRIVYGKETVESSKLLTCFGGFTADNWGVLGRRFYPSNWWTPLKTALSNASVGSDQAFRDKSILHLYLAYPKNTGTVAAGLSSILKKQSKADSATFQKALRGLSVSQRARVRAALRTAK